MPGTIKFLATAPAEVKAWGGAPVCPEKQVKAAMDQANPPDLSEQ